MLRWKKSRRRSCLSDLRRCNKLEVPCAEEECAALLLKAALLPGGNNGAS
jgi:hypothetical protein